MFFRCVKGLRNVGVCIMGIKKEKKRRKGNPTLD